MLSKIIRSTRLVRDGARTTVRQDGRFSRVDRIGVLQLVDQLHPVQPDAIEARRTPQGYVRVEARLARDGVQEYSDGVESWGEYRDRAELRRAAITCLALPVTNDHPPRMLDATNTTPVVRGWAVDNLRIATDGDVSYLASDIIIFDDQLIARIAAGKIEMSIGFTARIVESNRSDARFEQVDITLNHVSFVDEARGGPQVRALFDGRVIAA